MKIFSRSRFYGTHCFSILAKGPHLNATINLRNIFRSSSVDAIMFNFETLIWMLLFFRGPFQQVQDSVYNLTFKLLFIIVFFHMVHNKKLLRRSSVKLSITFIWLEKNKCRRKLSKTCSLHGRNREILVHIIFEHP